LTKQSKLDAALSRTVSDRLGEANTLRAICFLHLDQGDGEKGLEALNTALALYQAIGARVGTSNTLWGLGRRLAEAGELAKAEPLMAEAVDLAQVFAPGLPVTEY
jgi:hypothetical protein